MLCAVQSFIILSAISDCLFVICCGVERGFVTKGFPLLPRSQWSANVSDKRSCRRPATDTSWQFSARYAGKSKAKQKRFLDESAGRSLYALGSRSCSTLYPRSLRLSWIAHVGGLEANVAATCRQPLGAVSWTGWTLAIFFSSSNQIYPIFFSHPSAIKRWRSWQDFSIVFSVFCQPVAVLTCKLYAFTCHRYSSSERELENRFSRSEIKGQGHMCTSLWML